MNKKQLNEFYKLNDEEITLIKTELGLNFIGLRNNENIGSNYYHDGCGGSQMIYEKYILEIKNTKWLLNELIKELTNTSYESWIEWIVDDPKTAIEIPDNLAKKWKEELKIKK